MNSRSPLRGRPCGIAKDALVQTRCIIHALLSRSEGNQRCASLRLSSGGSSQPGRSVPAAVQHAFPHAVIIRAGAPPAQRGRGLAPSAQRRADLSGNQRWFTAGSNRKKYKNSDFLMCEFIA